MLNLSRRILEYLDIAKPVQSLCPKGWKELLPKLSSILQVNNVPKEWDRLLNGACGAKEIDNIKK
jgi:hypothetical protein